MKYLPLLIKLSENEKRVLIALTMLILLIIVIVGYLYLLVKKVMDRQGRQVDKMMYDIMKARVITDSKTFKKVSLHKSHIYFLKKSIMPFFTIFVFVFAMLIYSWVTKDFGLKFFSEAWADLTLILKWPMGDFFGLRVPVDWPVVSKAPDFSWSIPKYLSLLCSIGLVYGVIAYLVRVQALVARFFRIIKLKNTYFSKDLNKLAEKQI